jgi:hypothetical protein
MTFEARSFNLLAIDVLGSILSNGAEGALAVREKISLFSGANATQYCIKEAIWRNFFSVSASKNLEEETRARGFL